MKPHPLTRDSTTGSSDSQMPQPRVPSPMTNRPGAPVGRRAGDDVRNGCGTKVLRDPAHADLGHRESRRVTPHDAPGCCASCRCSADAPLRTCIRRFLRQFLRKQEAVRDGHLRVRGRCCDGCRVPVLVSPLMPKLDQIAPGAVGCKPWLGGAVGRDRCRAHPVRRSPFSSGSPPKPRLGQPVQSRIELR